MTVKEMIKALRQFNANDEVAVQDKVTEIVGHGKYMRDDNSQMTLLEIDALGEGPVLVIGRQKQETVSECGRGLPPVEVESLAHVGNPIGLATVRWRCPTDDGGLATTDISTRCDVLTLLDSGWPICPYCGEDMEVLEDENATG